MVTMLNKNQIIIKYYREGKSKSAISRELGISRKTVRKYIVEQEELKESNDLSEHLELGLRTLPVYRLTTRSKRKLTSSIKEEVKKCLKQNEDQLKQGIKKQLMKKVDVYEHLQELEYDIGYTTICNYISELNNKSKEAFIKQLYKPSETCEFDWGDVKLKIDGKLISLNLAVFTSAYSNYRWAKLFYRQDTLAFEQSHIDFLSFTKGVFKQMVYDNMRVAVSKFVGLAEDRATDSLLELSNYYKFGFRFCNIRKGNEKGHVERSVEYIRRKSFCKKAEFTNIEQANEHLLEICKKLNDKPQKSNNNKTASQLFEQEKKGLYPTNVAYISFKQENVKADKYCTVIVYGNRYSVPDYLVSKLLLARVFAEKVDIYFGKEKVCSHKRSYKAHHWTIKVEHYLGTFKRKPGAFAGSLAYDQLDEKTKQIYREHFIKNTRDFISLLQYCKDKSIEFNQVEQAVEYLKKITPKDINKDKILAVIDSKKERANKLRQTNKNNDLSQTYHYAKDSLDKITQLVNQQI